MNEQKSFRLHVGNLNTEWITLAIGPLFVTSGIGFFIYQIYSWLRNGEWVQYSLIWALSYVESIQSWSYYPTEWIGVHKILDIIPFSIFLIAIGVFIFIGVSNKDN